MLPSFKNPKSIHPFLHFLPKKKKKKKKIQDPQYYLLVSPTRKMLGFVRVFKTSFSSFIFEENQKYIQCSVRISFCRECKSLKGNAVVILLCDILLRVIPSVVAKKRSCKHLLWLELFLGNLLPPAYFGFFSPFISTP